MAAGSKKTALDLEPIETGGTMYVPEKTCTLRKLPDDENNIILWMCSECDGLTITFFNAPRYCAWCGAKVIKESIYDREY